MKYSNAFQINTKMGYKRRT